MSAWVVSEKDLDYEERARREREIRKGNFINEYLHEKRDKLGLEKFERDRQRLIEEAEEAYERQQSALEAARKRDEVERQKRLQEQAKALEIKIQWESPDPQFLEKQLFLSGRAERERTLRYYLVDVHESLRTAFILEFYKWLLDRLDRLEKRKLQP